MPSSLQGSDHKSWYYHATKFAGTWLKIFRLLCHPLCKNLATGLYAFIPPSSQGSGTGFQAFMQSSSQEFGYKSSGSHATKFIGIWLHVFRLLCHQDRSDFAVGLQVRTPLSFQEFGQVSKLKHQEILKDLTIDLQAPKPLSFLR